MAYSVCTIPFAKGTVEVSLDDFPYNPREDCTFGTMVCWHRRYNLGDSHSFSDPSEFRAEVSEEDNIILPVFMYDHSGTALSTSPFGCAFDSGQVGFIFVSKEKVRREYGVKRITKKMRELAIAVMKSEVSVYDKYLNGENYVVSFLDDKGSCVDSCGGFIGRDSLEDAVTDHLPIEYRAFKDEIITGLRSAC